MPYIHQTARAEIANGDPPANVGELTYVIQQYVNTYLDEQGLSYARIAEVLGALEGAKVDFIDRIVKPYERRKREVNGDVWTDAVLKEANDGA